MEDSASVRVMRVCRHAIIARIVDNALRRFPFFLIKGNDV